MHAGTTLPNVGGTVAVTGLDSSGGGGLDYVTLKSLFEHGQRYVIILSSKGDPGALFWALHGLFYLRARCLNLHLRARGHWGVSKPENQLSRQCKSVNANI